MKARHPETAEPGRAGRTGRVSSRTNAVASAGGKPALRVFGLPGAALAAAAALLLAPGAARADVECGIVNVPVITCNNVDTAQGLAYPDGIQYGGAGSSNALAHGNGPTVNIVGRDTGTTTIRATDAGSASQSVGIKLQSAVGNTNTIRVGEETNGVAHVINIVQGTSSKTNDSEYNNGIWFRQFGQNGPTTMIVRRGVTIGSASAPMEQHGILVRMHADRSSQGRGAGGLTLTSAATIHAKHQGIRYLRATGGTNDATTITNTGAIHSGVGNAAATGLYRDRPHGIHAQYSGTQMTGSLSVTNSGAITVGGPYTGILLNYWGVGSFSLDNSGNIGAVAGQTARQGIMFNYEYWENQSAQAVTLTNSGDITASEFGIRLKKVSGGDIAFTNSGAVTATGDAAQHMGHAIYLTEGIAFGEGRTYAANSGDITIVNSGALRSKNHGLYAYRPTTTTGNVADDLELTNSGAVTSEEGDGIRIERGDGTGDVTVDNSGAITAGANAIWIDEILTPATTGTVSVTHSAGALSAGRSGIVVQVASSNTAATVTPRASSAPQPLIDVAWGSTASSGATARGTTGTAANDNGRFATVGAGNAGAGQVLTFDQEAEGSKASGGVYGGPAGIEAYAISWRDVVAQVAKGDDPGAFASATAQTTAVPTGATVADNAYVAQFRAALENDEIAVAPALLTAIGTTATTAASDLTDAQIVTFLRVDNAGRRTLLRNVLAQGLTDGEKAILQALATNGNVDAALTAAGFTDDTSDDGDYWSLVKALLDRYNVGDIRVNVHSGSIAASRGDGIRAYYATPHDSNGKIDVAIGAGASVAGSKAGIYVANAGGAVTVESAGTIRAGTDGIRVVKPGTSGDITITTTAGSSITADAGAGIHPQDNAGYTGTVTVTNGGDITAETWGIYANRLGAGTVSVANTGGTVWGMTEPGIFAANKEGDASDLSVDARGGTIRSSGLNKAAVHAWNRGTGDLAVTLASGAGAISKHAAGVFADLGNAYSTTDQVEVAQGGTIMGRTGVYVRVAHGATAATPAARTAQPLIDVAWTGAFSRGTAPAVAQNDNGRFAAATAAEALAFDHEAAAVKAVEGTVNYDGPHYGGAAGIEAHALSWRDVAAQAAKGDDPGAIANAAAQANLLSTTHADSERTAILAQFKAALGNEEIAVAAKVLADIDSTATSVADLSDAEIVTYLSTDDDAIRTLLRNVLAQGLSDKEKAVLRAAATGEGLAAALADADAAFSTAYQTAVNALLNRYNVGNIDIAMTGGSIDSRGDGIRAYYATPHDNNGAISVEVGAGANIAADKAGIYVANGGSTVTVESAATIRAGTDGIRVVQTGTSGDIAITTAAGSSIAADDGAGIYPQDNAGHTGTVTVTNDGDVTGGTWGIRADRLGSGVVSVTSAGGTVFGMTEPGIFAANKAGDASTVTVRVTGGAVRSTGAGKPAIHALNRGTGDIVVAMTGESVDSRGDGIRAEYATFSNSNGAVSVTVAASVTAGEAGVHVKNAGDDVTVESSGTVRAGTYGIRVVHPGSSGDIVITAAAGSSITATSMRGISPEDNAGHTGTVTVTNNGDITAGTWGIHAGRLGSGAVTVTTAGGTVLGMTEPGIFAANKAGDASTVTVNVQGGTVRSTGPGDPAVHAQNQGTGDIVVAMTGGNVDSLGDGIRADYLTSGNNNGAISVSVAAGATVAGGEAGIHVANAGLDEGGMGTADDILTQTVTVDGTVTGGTDAAVRLAGGGTLTVGAMGMLRAGSSGRAIWASGSGRAVIRIDGEARGGSGAGTEAAPAVHLAGANSRLTIGMAGRVALDEGAELAIRRDGAGTALIVLQDPGLALADGRFTRTSVEDAIERLGRTVGGGGAGDIQVAAGELTDPNVLSGIVLTLTLPDGETAPEPDDSTYSALPAARNLNGAGDVEADAETENAPAVKVISRNAHDIAVNVTPAGRRVRSTGHHGVHAYYATLGANNGSISVTVADGATVEGGRAGIHVANAGLDEGDDETAGTADDILKQTVTVDGTVTGGTGAAVRLAGGGTLTVGAAGKVHAGSSGRAIWASGSGRAEIRIDGEVRGGSGAGAEAVPAVHLAGANSRLTVGPAGRIVRADGAELAIRRDGEGTVLIAIQDPDLAAAGGGFTQASVDDAIERLGGTVGGDGDGEIRVAMGEPDDPDLDSGVYFPVTLDEIALGPASERSVKGGDVVETENVPAIEAVSRGAVDIVVDVAAGARIRSTGHHGIHAYYPEFDESNGSISVTVAAGASVTGDMAGIHVENAGLDAGEDGIAGTADDILKQTVTVHGTVTGGTDAAVHLAGGGRLRVHETGEVHAGSGRPAILVNDPGRAEIHIDGKVHGSAGAVAAVHLTGGGRVVLGPKGRVNPNGAALAIRRDGATTELIVIQNPGLAAEDGGFTQDSVTDAVERRGTVGGTAGGKIEVAAADPFNNLSGAVAPFSLNPDGTIPDGAFEALPEGGDKGDKGDGKVPMVRFDCDIDPRVTDKCRLYAALPSALLAMNGLPTYGERMAAARDGSGGWARIDGADGEWKAKNATQPNMAFDYRRYGVQAGVDLAVGGDARFGVSVRGLQGSAEMAGSGGKIELSGVGAGVHGTAFLGGGFHVDAQAMTTWYDVKLTSGRMVLTTDGAKGLALGVEVGRRTDMGGGLTVTPGAGLSWSEVDMSFARSANERVSLEDARSLAGRAGLRVEMEAGFLLFGSVEATHEFSDRRSARIWGAQLASDVALSTTETEKTGFRIGAGGAHGWGDGRYALRASAGYAARGIGDSEIDGGISFVTKF